MECKMKGCHNEVLVKKDQLCRKHYLRKWKYGDPTFVKTGYQLKGKQSPAYKHGAWGEELLGVWSNMLSRCYNENDPAYARYGAKGIFVCDRWKHDFWAFKKDMGPRPKGLTIDRKNSRDGYYPENCRWANYTVQNRNKPDYVKLSMEKAREIRGLKRRGRNGKGDGLTRKEIAMQYGVSVATIKKVLSCVYWKEGQTTEKILKKE